MNKLPRSMGSSVNAVVHTGMPRWRHAQVALSPGPKLEVIEKLIKQTRQLEFIKRHASRL